MSRHRAFGRFGGSIGSICTGALLVLGFAPWHAWPLALIALAGWLWWWRDASARSMLLQGFCLGLGLYLAGVSWVYVSVHVYGGAPGWLAVLLVLLLAAYLASFLALALAAAWWLAPAGAWRWLAAVPAAWLFSEHLRGYVLDGFPWLGLGYILLEVPGAAGLLALGGILLLGWLCWLLAGALVLAAQRRWWAALGVVLSVSAGFALAPAAQDWTSSGSAPLRVAVVQGNMAQDQKWRPDNLQPTLELYERLTASVPEADLVVWPEVSIPASLYRVQPWFDRWQALAAEREQTVLAGVITRAEGNPYNTMYALGPRPGRYVKQHLVPFGEYFPVPDWVRPVFDWLDLPFTDIHTDLPSDRYLYADDIPLALSICFEDVFPREFARQAVGSAILVNTTNDAWFSGSLAPHQHLQIAQARAAETGRWLIRAANTGISAMISPDLRIHAAIPWGERAVQELDVWPRTGSTPFMRWLDLPLSLLAGALLALLLLRRIVRISPSRLRAPELN